MRFPWYNNQDARRGYGGIAQLVEHSVHTRQVVGSSPTSATIFAVAQFGPLVKRLRHRPFTAVTWVQFPYGSPRKDSGLYTILSLFN